MDPVISIASPQILAIPIKEQGEPLIDLIQQSEIAYGPSPEIPNNRDYTKMRQTVYEKLKQAQSLLPLGIRFCLYEGYRSISLQKMLFENRYAKIKNRHPNWTHRQLFLETIKMVSPVVNLDKSLNVPPHATGAAIDVYLIDAGGIALDMGIHPKDWMEDLQGTLSFTASSSISAEAQKNRRLMSSVLESVGFVNYPNEYWHWSYGDRLWAYYQGKTHALYNICH